MVRFCDKDIVSINYDSINRQELLRYFLRGHTDEMICIFDENNEYIGSITYYSLLYNADLDEAINRDRLVLNEDIWLSARKKFKDQRLYLNQHTLLPVVDGAGQLISFAYEDNDANREIRQLRELSEKPDAVQFHDIYPEYDCVIIYGFNELAYFFAGYLKEQGIPVRVEDAMWEGFFQSAETPFMEHRCMKIYAEGTWTKPSNWEENLLRSVSAEFECIDLIYEENIRQNHVKEAVCTGDELFHRLKNAEAVAVMGKDVAAQDAYDFLIGKGIDVKCFVITDRTMTESKMFGKPVYNLSEIEEKYGGNIVLIDNHWENSPWGIGKVDYLDYVGYKRNEGLFLLRDYIRIRGNSLKDALRNEKIVMTGDVLLCERLQRHFEINNITAADNVLYINLTGEQMTERHVLHIADVDSVSKDSLCLVVLPESIGVNDVDKYGNYRGRKAEITSCLEKNGFTNYTDYFSFTQTFIDLEKENANKYPDGKWKAKSVVLGSIDYFSGNMLFDGLIDNHPFIMTISMQRVWSVNLFWLCAFLADRDIEDIIYLLQNIDWSIYAAWKWAGEETFIEKLRKYLESGKRYTSQELFVVIHAALCEKSAEDINNTIIYWEPHWIPRDIVEKCTIWLGDAESPCNIVNVVRNAYIVKGSGVKWYLIRREAVNLCCHIVTEYREIRKEEYENSKRIIVRFEDLKCSPAEELHRICDELEIPWSDTLMEVTHCGKKYVFNNGKKEIKDFDLTPVYNLYEEYLSEFDRFRITLLCAPWQKEYGYPYADITLFTKRELQEMFLKDFRFMDSREYDKEFVDERSKLSFFIGIQEDIRRSLQRVRMLSVI